MKSSTNDLFYLISSLPALMHNQKPRISSDEFLTLCNEQLDDKKARSIASISLSPDGNENGLDAHRNWQEWLVFVKNCIAEIRASRLKRPLGDCLRETRVFDSFTKKSLEDAFSLPTPAEREAAIDLACWNFLEDLAATHLFDLDALAIYRLKLLLLEKRDSRSFEEGIKVFDGITDAAIEQAKNTRI